MTYQQDLNALAQKQWAESYIEYLQSCVGKENYNHGEEEEKWTRANPAPGGLQELIERSAKIQTARAFEDKLQDFIYQLFRTSVQQSMAEVILAGAFIVVPSET